jgi:hypothetical protein
LVLPSSGNERLFHGRSAAGAAGSLLIFTALSVSWGRLRGGGRGRHYRGVGAVVLRRASEVGRRDGELCGEHAHSTRAAARGAVAEVAAAAARDAGAAAPSG